jgi:2-aminobenzoate-CoA ligase
MLSYPPRELWPEKSYDLPELAYPNTLNACHELLDANLALGRGSAPAIYFADSVITYNQLANEVMKVAGALRQRGISPGDCVVIRLLNRPHFVTAFLALIRIGAVAVPTAPLLRHREISAIIDGADPMLVISETDLWDELERMGRSSLSCVNIQELQNGPPLEECTPTAQDNPAVLLYTSGSTGVPKGCMHSHADLLAICDTYGRHILEPSPADRFGGHPTMAFGFGLGALLLLPFRFGASTVLLDHFTPEKMIQSIRNNKVTIAFCVPISLRMMMKQSAELRDELRSLRFVVNSGETLPASVYRTWRASTGIEILDGLGSTEMLYIFISSRPGRSRPGATGETVPGYIAQVVDEKTMQPVPDGQPGLLAVKGPTGCRYLHLKNDQQKYVRQGWNIPGDIYIRDSDGFFRYQCRNDDMIICGGINIAGLEIESVLLEHPSVLEAAVVASPDELHGMVPKAFVVVQGQHQASDNLKKELQDFVRQELARYKYPRKIEFVAELPKTSTGKIRRTELRRAEFQNDGRDRENPA